MAETKERLEKRLAKLEAAFQALQTDAFKHAVFPSRKRSEERIKRYFAHGKKFEEQMAKLRLDIETLPGGVIL